uniref:Uncharacterized protein n=1 Tax=Tanacetum cinerariifolium TaxID=118510 RepID=A0A6L2N9P9_TANCI|nr:hypothetical protein [Tanacetum cinerariifolium]
MLMLQVVVDRSSVKYALTVRPTIHTSCIKQFWTTIKGKKVDNEVWIQALVDGKMVNIKESSIRRTLRFVQLVINHQLGDMTHHKEIFDTPSLTKKVFANMKRVEKHTKEPKVPPIEPKPEHNIPLPLPSHDLLPSGEDSLKLQELIDLCNNMSNKVLDLESEVLYIRVDRLEEENMVLKELMGVHSKVDSDEHVMEKEESSKQGRKIANINADELLLLLKMMLLLPVLKVPKPRKRKGVIIQDTKETTTTVTVQPKVQAKDKEKAILIEEPKPLKRKVQIKLDEEVARQLEAELNANVDWNTMIEQVQQKEKLTDAVMNYQALKRNPLTKVQARRNMIVYLKNMAGYKMNYFKGMTYDEIRPLFEKHYNYNQAFLNKVNEEVKVPEREVRQEKEVEIESSKREGESLEKEVAKKQKMEQETEELKSICRLFLMTMMMCIQMLLFWPKRFQYVGYPLSLHFMDSNKK